MSRKLLYSMIVMVVGVSFVAAEEFGASITKVDGDKVTLQKFKKGEKGKKGEKDGDPITLNAAGASVVKGKFNKGEMKLEAGDKIENGLKNEMFSKEKLGENGVFARITTEGEGDKAKITQILIFGGFGKKKKDATE